MTGSSKPFILRPYQSEALTALRHCRRDGQYRALVHLATGLGKTALAAADVTDYLNEHPTARALFVSHMNDISSQAITTFRRVNPLGEYGRFTAGQMPDTRVVFATFQGLYRSLHEIVPTTFDYIIWDEAHHIEAETFKEVREHFTPCFELGLTATPARADGLDILEYFGEPVYVKGLAEGIGEGWLSAVDYHILLDETVKAAVKDGFAFTSQREVQQLFAIRARNEEVAKEVLAKRRAIGFETAKTIVFCHNVAAAEEMAKLLGGIAYHSILSSDRRREIMRDFRTGHVQVICTVDMFNEGIDIPDAKLVVFLRSTSSKTIFEQQLGRGLRKAPGKDMITVLDFVANVERIDFVRELGRHVGRAKEAFARKQGTSSRAGVSLSGDMATLVTASNFVFEDSTIQLLDRYNHLSGQAPEGYLTTPEVARLVKRTESTVRSFVKKHDLGLSWYRQPHARAPIPMWSPEQINFAVRLFRTLNEAGEEVEVCGLFSLSNRLGIAQAALRRIAKELGITPSTMRLPSGIVGEGVTQPEAERIIDFVTNSVPEGYIMVTDLAKELGITRSTVHKRAEFVGIDIKNTLLYLNHRYLSPEQVALLRAYEPPKRATHERVMESWRKHQHVMTVANEMGVSNTIIYKHLRKAGVSLTGNTSGGYRPQHPPLPEGYLTTPQVSALLGVSQSTVLAYSKRSGWFAERYLPKMGPPCLGFSPERLAQLKEHYISYKGHQRLKKPESAREDVITLKKLAVELGSNTKRLERACVPLGIVPKSYFLFEDGFRFRAFGVTFEERDQIKRSLRETVPPGWLEPKAAALTLGGISPSSLKRQIAEQGFEHRYWGGTMYISPDALERVRIRRQSLASIVKQRGGRRQKV